MTIAAPINAPRIRARTPDTRPLGSFAARWHDVVVMTRRNLVHIRREPAQLSDVTVQPVLFTLLFIYVFGSGVPIHGGSYKDFALAGLMSLNLTTSAIGTGVGISADMSTGVIDRFRSLPLWRASVLIGRSLSDLLAAALCVSIVAVTGLAIGWRTSATPLSVLGGFAVILLFSYALGWMCACMGLVSKGPESAQGVGLIVLFPIAIVSNAMVPTQGMPGWLRTIADWNPVSSVTSATRNLFGNPNPSAAIRSWPMEHPIWASLMWSVLILAVCAPLAVHLFRRRTTE
jgi:ABC-2 type transport system permease protein